jgi:uncharacterized membrane protein YfcA
MSWGDIDVLLAFGGLLAGLLVGLTGMGGALIVTPMLVLVFGVPPAAAISSDVVAGAVMKPVGAWVHMRAETVHWKLVLWISVGSVPGVLVGTALFSKVLSTPGAEDILRTLIGVVVLVALAAMLARRWVSLRAARSQQISHTQIPGIWIGARMSARYDGSALRWLLMAVLAATAAKLLGAPSLAAGAVGVAGLGAAGVAALRDRSHRAPG